MDIKLHSGNLNGKRQLYLHFDWIESATCFELHRNIIRIVSEGNIKNTTSKRKIENNDNIQQIGLINLAGKTRVDTKFSYL